MHHHFKDKHGSWKLTTIPGNNSVAISHDVYIFPASRGKGIGQLQHLNRLQWARDNGLTYLMATVEADNSKQIHIMAKSGWRCVDRYFNDGQSDSIMPHWVEVWSINLKGATNDDIAAKA